MSVSIQQTKNDYFLLSLINGSTIFAVAVVSLFWIKCLKKEMRNNVDKWSLRIIQWLYFFQENKISLVVETTYAQNLKISLPHLLW